MKKITLMGLFVLLLASCMGEPKKDIGTMRTEKQNRAASIVEADLEMYRKNIVVKTMGDDYIVYEYSDVRIDKVAPLASRYCFETNPGKKAYLRDIYMHKNHKRRATFDCVDLASK